MPRVGERYCPQEIQDFTPLEDWLAKIPHTVLSWNEKAMFSRLKRFGQKSGEIFPSVETLAAELGFEEHTARRALAALEEQKFIARERHKNAPSRFFLVRNMYIPGTTEDGVEESADLSIYTNVNSQKCNSETTDLYIPSLGTEETTLRDKEPPTPLEEIQSTQLEELNLEDPIELFTRNAYRSGRDLKIKFSAKTGKRLLERLRAAEERAGPEEFRQGLLNYLGEESDWLYKNNWPLAGFLRRIETSGEYASARPRQPVNVPTPRMSAGIPHTNGSPPTPKFDLIGEWNKVVGAMPIANWSEKHDNHKRLRELGLDEDVVVAWPKVCAKVQSIHTINPDAQWMNFHWIIKQPGFGEVANWRRIERGDFDYLLTPEKYKPKNSGSGGLVAETIAKVRAGTLK